MMNSYICMCNSNYASQYNMSSLHWCFHCSYSMPPCPSGMLDAQFNCLSESMKALQESMKELQANNKRMLSSICHVRSLLQEEMQLYSTFTDTPEILDATTITSALESAYDDSNTEVADFVKSHLDSQLPVLVKGSALPVEGYIHTLDMEFDGKVFDIMPYRDIFVEFRALSTTIGWLPPSFGLHDCKWVDTGKVSGSFDIYQHIKLLRKKFYIGRILVGYIGVNLNDYYILAICCYLTNWVDTGQELPDDSGCTPLFIDPLSSSSNAHKLFDEIATRSKCVAVLYNSEYTGEVEVFIECSDNLTSFCNSSKLLGISLENSFFYSLDGASTSIVATYIIDQLRSVEVNCKKIRDVLHQRSHSALVEKKMVDALGSVNLSQHDKTTHLSIRKILWHYDPLTDVTSTNDQFLGRKVRTDNPQTMVDYHGNIVVHLLILIGDMPLLIPPIREAILLISHIHMSLYVGWIVEECTHVVLGGVVETFNKCFIYLWNPTWNSIVVFLRQYFGLLWHKFIAFLDHSSPFLLGSSDKVAPNARGLVRNANNLIGKFRSFVCLLSDRRARATILPLLSELPSSEQVEPGLPLLLPSKFECKIWNSSRQLNLELVTSQPARKLEWTVCVAYLKGWTLLSPQQQEAEGILTLAGQIEGLSISFVGIPGSSHSVPAVHDFLHKEPYVATDIEKHTLEKLTNYLLQFRNSSRHALAAMYSALHQRAILVYYEVQHIHAFRNSVSSQLSEETMLTKLNAFLNESHQYDRILYACYSTELEELIWICHDKGLSQKVLLQCMDHTLCVVQKSNITQLKYPLYVKGVYGFMLNIVLGVVYAVGITNHELEREGTNVELGHSALSFLLILPSTAPKVDIIDIGSMYFILVEDVKLLCKSLRFDIITWLLCLGRLLWPCLEIGCMAMHLQALVTFTGLTECSYSERALEFAATLTLVSIIGGDVFYMEAHSGAVTRVYWNDTCDTTFVLNENYVPTPKIMMLYSNLEDKVLFEDGRIVMNITRMEDQCEKMSNYIWDPGKMCIY